MTSRTGQSGQDASEASLSKWTESGDITSPTTSARGTGFTPGTMLAGRYRIVALLGSGGMGEIYRADDLKLGQPVALKFLHGALSSERLQALYAEVRIGRQVSHPNVCRIYDVVEFEGRTFLAMEYVDGEDLGSLLARIGRLPPDKAVEIAHDLCAGLAAVHDKGVVHRDLKPANVMIDGRGRARLTDFGLAIALEAQAGGAHAGTPAYMSPEQLGGREVTARSDLFALGLLFYEMFAGRRFFDARTVGELQEQHRQARTPRLQSAARLVDPVVERAILHCLEADPNARPASARALIAMLPGGDPLDAAVAAGETPSPEMVAAAGAVGDLSPPAAWACLLAVLVGYAAAASLGGRTTLLAKAPLPKPPAVLVERAREILMRLGQDSMADWAYSFDVDQAYLDHVGRESASPETWERLATAQPGPYVFFYRQSPRTLIASNRDGMVTRADPPSDVPGMAEVVLDPRGRLLSFVAPPPLMEEPREKWAEPDWPSLFREAGLDPAAFQPLPPRWAAPVDSDRKAAWSGVYPGGERAPVRVEAAAYHGRPVWFAVLPPWAEASRAHVAREAVSSTPFTEAGMLIIALAIPIGGLVLARRNLRLGRGDRKGGFKVAALVFGSYSLARLCRADHVSAPADEIWILIKVFSYPSLWAILVWLMYLALEPYARRRWPRVLISWKRLLSGQLRDPLVGRDLLIGVGAGFFCLTLLRLAGLMAPWAGEPLPLEPFITGPTLTSLRQAFFRLFVNQYSAIQYGLLFLFVLMLLRVVVRSTPIAFLLWCMLAGGPLVGENSSVEWAFGALRAAFMLLVLMRAGLLAFVSMLFVMFAMLEVPLPLELRSWYALSGLPVLGFGVALAAYGFYASLGGKSPFGRALLED